MEPAPEIAAADAAEEIAGGALVVDVREQVEWDAGHISGAVLIPLGELGGRVDELPRDRRMVIVCRTGSRSGYAADALHGAGYDVANLRGGPLRLGGRLASARARRGVRALTATVRIGTCSWADESLVKAWYPRNARTAEGRLRHYAELFDTVEVNSSYYAIPTAEAAAAWARQDARRLRLPREGVRHDDPPSR